MSEPNPQGEGSTAATTAEKKKRSTAKKLTFVFQSDGKVSIKQHESMAFSVAEAWKEVNGNGNGELLFALKGHADVQKEQQLRKPTYDELKALAGL